MGFTSRLAKNQKEAWAFCYDKTPLVVILDPTVGEGTYDFMNKVRNHILTRSVQFLCLCGHVPFEILRQIQINGAAYTCILPLDPEEFKSIIDFLINPTQTPRVDGEVAHCNIPDGAKKCELLVYGRVGFFKDDGIRVECNLKPNPGSTVGMNHPLISKWAVPWTKMQVKSTSTSNLYYNYKQGLVLGWEPDVAWGKEVKKFIKENKATSSPKKMKVLVIGNDQNLIENLQKYAETQPFSFRALTTSRNLKFDLEYYNPLTVIVDASEKFHDGKTGFKKTLALLLEKGVRTITYESVTGEYQKVYDEFSHMFHVKKMLVPELAIQMLEKLNIAREAKSRDLTLDGHHYFSKKDPHSRAGFLVDSELTTMSEKSFVIRSRTEIHVGTNVELQSRFLQVYSEPRLFLKVTASRRGSGEFPYEHEFIISGREETVSQNLRRAITDVIMAEKRAEASGLGADEAGKKKFKNPWET